MLRPVRADAVMPDIESARNTLRTEAAGLLDVAERIDDNFMSAIALIADCDGCVIVTGVGKSGWVAQKVTATLASTGTPAHFLHPSEALHGDLGRVTNADVLLAFSHGGESTELTHLLPALRQRGAPLVAITSRKSSTLARAARVAIVYGSVEEACPLKLAPSTSCTVMMALGDALAFSLMEYRGYQVEDFHSVHPSGSLGRLSQPVTAVMRSGTEMRCSQPSRSVRDVVVSTSRPGRRTGAVLLVDDEGKLAGIFTDSDLARILERRDVAALDDPVENYMTRKPLVAREFHKVADAVGMLRDRRVSELPVLDRENRPLGVVDITDLMDLLPALERAA